MLESKIYTSAYLHFSAHLIFVILERWNVFTLLKTRYFHLVFCTGNLFLREHNDFSRFSYDELEVVRCRGASSAICYHCEQRAVKLNNVAIKIFFLCPLRDFPELLFLLLLNLDTSWLE